MALTKNTLILLVAAFLTALFGYLFNPLVTARALAPEGFAALGIFLSLNHILSFPQRPLGLSLNRSIAKYNVQGDDGKVGSLLRFIFKKLLFTGLPCAVILILISPLISNYLNLETQVPVITAILFAYAGLFLHVIKVILQATLQFTRLAIVMTSDALFRALVGGSLFLVGIYLGLLKILTVYIASYVIVALICAWLLRKTILAQGSTKLEKIETPSSLATLWTYSIFTTVAVSIDILAVKHYFPANEAGIYIAAAGVSKMLFLLMNPIVTVNYSLMCHRAAEQKSMDDLLFKSLGHTLLVCLAFLTGIYLFASLLIQFSYGEAFTAATNLLIWTSLAFCPLSLVLIFGNYFMARNTHTFAWLLIFSGIIQYLFIYFYHDSLQSVIYAYTAGGLLQLGIVVVLYFLNRKK